MKELRNIGQLLVILSLVFSMMATSHFGNNFWPSCPAEWVCALVSLSMCLSGARILYLTRQ